MYKAPNLSLLRGIHKAEPPKSKVYGRAKRQGKIKKFPERIAEKLKKEESASFEAYYENGGIC